MRAGELKGFKNKLLWKDNDLVNEVCRLVETGQDNKRRRYMKKITDLIYNGVAQASPRLENLVYVLCGHDMVAMDPLTCSTPLRKDWICIIETEFKADDKIRPHPRQPTVDLSLKELRQFSKSPDMKSI